MRRAHALYRDLFGGIEDLIQGKRLLIVPSGALTQLPFEVLVTAKPDETLPRFEAYKKAAWLGQRQAITILPSVGSLKALRAAKASAAPEPFAGFGNPLLTGEDGTDRSAWDEQDCSKAAPPKQSRIVSLAVSIASLFRGGAANVEDLRRQAPLPETADELFTVARELGVPGRSWTRRSISAAARPFPSESAFAKRRACPRPRGSFRHPWAARGRNRAVCREQGRARAAADAARRGERGGQWPAHRVRGRAVEPQRRLGGHVGLQHGCRVRRWRGGAFGLGARVLLRRGARAARLALVCGFGGVRRHHHRRGERHEGQP